MVIKPEQTILIACQNDDFVEDLSTVLSREGYKIVTARNGDEAVRIIDRQQINMALVEDVLEGKSGLEVLDYCQSLALTFPVVIMAKEPSIEKAVLVVKKGAANYIALDATISPKRILEVVKDTFSSRNKELTNADSSCEITDEASQIEKFEGLVGVSPAMKKLYKLINRVAQSDVTVLITGESGTGKELVAQAIHRRSNRRDKPFVPINCGAIPEELLESEFFGHEKGAFSGAIRTKIGRFELANGGTIFLDEIGEMKLPLQVKLLRFLQEHKFERVGGLKTIEVDVRVIAATNKDLWKAVQEGSFREDLFYRLNVVPLYVPPLRERKEDIPLLVENFLERYASISEDGGGKKKVTPEVMECFMEYSWPGNVRELENIIKRLIILSDGNEITVKDLPERLRPSKKEKLLDSSFAKLPETGLDLKKMLEDLERKFIQQALERTGGVKSQAAKLLGLNRTTLIEKMKKLGMDLSYKPAD
jgi:DNA-binding NtrC family response regulator